MPASDLRSPRTARPEPRTARLEPSPAAKASVAILIGLGVVGAHPAGSEHAYEVRAFVPGVGVAEDPVTGSLNASVAAGILLYEAARARGPK